MTQNTLWPLRGITIACLMALVACQTSDVEDDGDVARSRADWPVYDRVESHPAVVRRDGLRIPLRDGVHLAASVLLPAVAEGTPDSGPFPVILTQTGYNKSVPVLRSSNEYFVRRGYVHLSVDVRGTGASEGQWEAFSETEQEDYLEVLDWAVAQPWSDGRIGTWGASFAAITQLFTAAHQHPAHKAVFAIVPMGDAYRDIVFTGGQINVGFIPLWMGLVTTLGLIPADFDLSTPATLVQHVQGALTGFQVPTIARSAVGLQGQNFDGPFWRTRSPLEVANRIRTPTFIVGGLNDLFQRGQPLLYEAIRRQSDSRLLIGPWMHVEGSSGAGLPRDGVPDLDHLALQWFDEHVLELDTGTEDIPPVTQFVYGHDAYVSSLDWPHPQARAQRWYLGHDGTLDERPPAAAEEPRQTLQFGLNGLCSTSTVQWTAGALASARVPCLQDNRFNEVIELTYTSAPFEDGLYINGPMQADLWVSSTAQDASLVVRITEVDPDGRSRELTNGILTVSLRATDLSRGRYLFGESVQPWHPFSADGVQSLQAGEAVPVSVEIFPSSFYIRPGYRLRLSVGPSDFPHGTPPVLDLLDQSIGVLSVHSGAEFPSGVTLPLVPTSALHASEHVN